MKTRARAKLAARIETAEEAILPPRFADWFASRGWTPRDHQLQMVERGREGLVVELLLKTIATLPVAPLHAPMPADPRVARICRELLADPARDDSLDDWAAATHMSRRTLTRLFRQETGMSLAGWRQHVRLLEAVARLACGEAVSKIAFEVGYDSPSAFTAVFQRVFGTAPSRYLVS